LGPKIIAAAYFIVFARYSNASEYAEMSSLEVGFRRKSQDTGTIQVGFTSNRSRKPVVASWTATPSSPSFRPKYHVLEPTVVYRGSVRNISSKTD